MIDSHLKPFDRVMRAIFVLLHVAFVVALLTAPDDQPVLKGVLVVIGAAGVALGFYAPAMRRLQILIERRWMAFTPIVWFLLLSCIVIWGGSRISAPHLWSAVMMWTSTVFFWLFVYWLLRYIVRTFVMDARRNRDWQFLLLVTSLMCAFGAVMPFITVTRVVIPNNYKIERWDIIMNSLSWSPHPPDYLDFVAYYNTDAYTFLSNNGLFLTGWPESPYGIIHRPTYYLFTSQVCRLLNLPLDGYASGTSYCYNVTRGMIAFWIVNLGMAYFSGIVIYELVRHYLGSASVARMAALLAVVSGFTLYFFAIATTDYAELFIAIASLWLIHRLFSAPSASWGRIAIYGVVFGLLLLLKLNAIYLIFGILLAVILLRFRLLAVFTLVPALTYAAYRLLMGILNVPFTVTEASSEWKTVNWLFGEFLPQYNLFDKARSLTILSSQVLDKTAYLFGILLFVGVFVMILNTRFPRRIMAAGWLLFISICAWMPLFFYSYVQHVVGLMPFVYGAVALGADSAAERVRARFADPTAWQARLLSGLVLLLPLLVNLVQWLTWGPKDWINWG